MPIRRIPRGAVHAPLPHPGEADPPPAMTMHRLGLVEACLWTLGFLAAQTIAACAFLLILLSFAFGGWPESTDQAVELLLQLNLESSLLLTGVTSIGALFLLVPAARLRLGSRMRQRLWMVRPDGRSWILVLGAVVPLAVLSNALYAASLAGWNDLVAASPEIGPWSDVGSLELLRDQLLGAPFFVAVVVLALGPALGEELVFRGVIGQGLVQRFGVFAGVGVASLLFAAAHLFPPHALATIPLALFFHFAYLTTRSFWAPVALHFFNNALSVTVMKFPLVRELPDSPLVVVCSVLYIAAIAALLLRSPSAPPTARSGFAIPRLVHVSAAACILGFTTAFVWNALATA